MLTNVLNTELFPIKVYIFTKMRFLQENSVSYNYPFLQPPALYKLETKTAAMQCLIYSYPGLLKSAVNAAALLTGRLAAITKVEDGMNGSLSRFPQ